MKNIFSLFFLSVIFTFVPEAKFISKKTLKTKTQKINFFQKAYAVNGDLTCAYEDLMKQAEDLIAELKREKWKYKSRCSWRAPDMCFMSIFFDKKIEDADERIPPIQEALQAAKDALEENPAFGCENPDGNQNPPGPPPTIPNPSSTGTGDTFTGYPAGFVRRNPTTGAITVFPKGPDEEGVNLTNRNIDDPNLWKKIGLNDQQMNELKEWKENDLLKGDLSSGSQNNENQDNKSQLLSQADKNKKKLIDVPLQGGSSAGSTNQTNRSSKKNQALKAKKSNSKSKKGFKSLFRKGFKGKNKKLAQSMQSGNAKGRQEGQGDQEGQGGHDANNITHLGLFLRIHQRYEKLNTKNHFFKK